MSRLVAWLTRVTVSALAVAAGLAVLQATGRVAAQVRQQPQVRGGALPPSAPPTPPGLRLPAPPPAGVARGMSAWSPGSSGPPAGGGGFGGGGILGGGQPASAGGFGVLGGLPPQTPNGRDREYSPQLKVDPAKLVGTWRVRVSTRAFRGSYAHYAYGVLELREDGTYSLRSTWNSVPLSYGLKSSEIVQEVHTGTYAVTGPWVRQVAGQDPVAGLVWLIPQAGQDSAIPPGPRERLAIEVVSVNDRLAVFRRSAAPSDIWLADWGRDAPAAPARPPVRR